MKVKISPTRTIEVFGIDDRSLNNLAWCAVTYGINRLFWVDGYLICIEFYEASFEHEIEKKIFFISQVCYTSFPKYTKVLEVETGTQIPIVDASHMQIYKELLKALLKNKKK